MNVLVCRPKKDAQVLVDKLNDNQVKAFCLPTINIEFLEPQVNLDFFTDIIFTSKYAVEGIFKYITPALLKRKNIYSVGASTASLLSEYGLTSKYPNKYNSESLLRLLDEYGVSDKKFLVVSGIAGNELLVSELSKKSPCHKLEVYKRVFKEQATLVARYADILKQAEPDIIVATSLDVFKSLVRVFEKIQLPEHAIVTITSSKMLEFVKEHGFSNTMKLDKLNNEYICQQILELIEAKHVDRKK